MRIQSGKLKGRNIVGQRKGLRPTTSVVKTALMNILKEEIHGKRFVDIFAGTGAVGFEALSTGAGEVVFVELNPQAVKLIRQNIEDLGLKQARVLRANALDFLVSGEPAFDFIFLSPPYDVIHWHQLLRVLERSTLIKPSTLIIVQHPKTVAVESFVLQKTDERRYGFNKLSFFRKKKED